MRNIEFENNINTATEFKKSHQKGIIGFLLSKKIVKTPLHANYLLIFVIIASIASIIFMRLDLVNSGTNKEATQEEIEFVGSEAENLIQE